MATTKAWFSLNEVMALFEVSRKEIVDRVAKKEIRSTVKQVSIGDGVNGAKRRITLYKYVDLTEVFGEPKITRYAVSKLLQSGKLQIYSDKKNKDLLSKEIAEKYKKEEEERKKIKEIERKNILRLEEKLLEHDKNEQVRIERVNAEQIDITDIEERLQDGNITTAEAERLLKIEKARAELLKNKKTKRELIARDEVEIFIREVYSTTWNKLEESIEKWGIEYNIPNEKVKEMLLSFRKALVRASEELGRRL